MPRQPIKDTDFLKKARERFKLANEADTDQAQRERDDISFEAGEQWPSDVKQARMGQQPQNGMPAIPARPTLVINKVREPVRQVLNQERASDIGIELVPADDFGDLGITPDDTEVTLREGLVRRIQRESQAADARTWAFKRAVIAGRGYYLVMTRFLPGKTWDQDIYLHRIYNQAGVLLDPAHEQPDGSDADWGFIGTWMPWDRAVAEYPRLADGSPSPFSDYGDGDFMAAMEEYPDWYRQSTPGDDGKVLSRAAVRVVDYWYAERTSRTLAIMDDGTAWWDSELPKDAQPVDTRTVVEKQIKFCKIVGGVLEVERTDWAGPDMPIIKVLGDEVLPYDTQRRAEGMVRAARDAQMGFNYMVSKQVEQVGLAPIPPLMLDPDAIDGYENIYAQLNTRPILNVPYRTYDDQGRELRPPMRPPADPNVLAISQSIGLFDATIKSTTAVPDSTLGNVDPSLKSGRAIREVVANAAQSTSNFLDNLARSIRYEGQVINNLLYPIYGAKPGRLVRILTGEGENQTMRIMDPEQQQQAQAQQQRAEKVAKLTKDAHFNVIVKVTKAYESRRTQEAASIAELMSANPELITWFGDLFFKNSDGPGHMAMAERAKVMLAPPIQQMLAQQEQGKPFDPQAQAQIAKLTERLQMVEGAAKQMDEELRTKAAENHAKVEIERIRQQGETERLRIEREKDIELQRMKNAASLGVAHINAETEGIVSAHEAVDEAIALDQQHTHEALQAELDRNHQRTMTTTQMAHDAALGDGQADRAEMEAERGHERGLETAEHAAALQPDGADA